MNERVSRLQHDFNSGQFVHALSRQIKDFAPRRMLVAFSGGVDSTVLLHALASHLNDLPASLTALHVDHGLHSDAGAWCRHCEEFCAAMDIPFLSTRLNLCIKKGDSVEALAREGRYRWFAETMCTGDALFTAHHRGDQAETVLLQLFRGAGVNGLAAMPEVAEFAGGHLLRPLINFSRDQLLQYASQCQLTWLDDPANSDTRYQRNFIRHEVLPLIRQHWPAVDKTLLRSAANCSDAMLLVEELAQGDLNLVKNEKSNHLLSTIAPLHADWLSSLSRQRIHNVFRYWIKSKGFAPPSERKLKEVVKQLVDATSSGGCVDWSGAELRRYRKDIYLQPKLQLIKVFPIQNWPAIQAFNLQETKIRLTPRSSVSEGLRKSVVENKSLSVEPRRGGEHIRLPNSRHRTTVKKLYQSKGVPPWVRDRLPLLYIEGRLAVIPGIALDDAFAAHDDEESIVIDVETIA